MRGTQFESLKLTESISQSRSYFKHRITRENQKPAINSFEDTKEADRFIKETHKKYNLSKHFNDSQTWRSQNKEHLRLIQKFEEI